MNVFRLASAVLPPCLGLLASEATAPAQCMQWAVAGGLAPGGACYELSVKDVGSGPALYAGINGYAARWNGSLWTGLAPMLNEDVTALGSYDDGSGPALYVGGRFTAISGSVTPMWHIAKLRGGAWQPLGTGLPTTYGEVYSMHVFDDGTGPQLYVGGYFWTYSSISSRNLVRWDGTAWSGVGGGAPYAVGSMCTYDDGSGPALYVGGGVGGLGKWNGSTWSSLGSGLTNSGDPGIAWALAVYDDGSGPALYAGGPFNRAGGVPVRGLAKWNGTAWSAVPIPQGGFNLTVRDLTVHDDGNGPKLYVTSLSGPAPLNGVSRWNGSSWLGLGSYPAGGAGATCLESFDDGQGAGPALYAGGPFYQVGGNLVSPLVARWYGGCMHTIDPLCFGDGTFAYLPCSNYGASMHGCDNSAQVGGALLSATGTTNPDTLVFSSTSQPVASTSIFLQSSALRPAHVLLGDGVLCLDAPMLRLYVKQAASGSSQAPGPGDPSITQSSAALGDPIAPGSVRYYQAWYRDTADFCSTSTYNLSNGLRVVW